jgi:tetratricopeptide (TPR) repeat protein
MPRETRSARPGLTGAGVSGPSARAVQKGVFRKEGEYWTVGYGGKSFRLKDTKGLGFLAHLLRHPGTEFHVLDLSGGIRGQRDDEEPGQSAQGLPRGDEDLEKAGIHVTSLGDAGEMLDEQAKVAYRRRLSELREELEKAKELGRVERAEQTEEEIDALTRELSRAVGLGGRNRRAISASERARQSITKTVKAVVDRIVQSDAALGDIFARCTKTGNFCSYQPDPEFPIAWEFAAATIEQADQPITSGDPAPARADRPESRPMVLDISPFPLAERTAFVGRESEVGAIRAAIDRALTGHGSVIMLFDGPGVGKTRLAMEMAEYASREGFRCAVGRCYERDEPFPFLPFAEIIESNLAQAASLDDYYRQMGPNAAEMAQIAPGLRRVFPDIWQPLELPPAQQRRYLFQSFSEALARAARTQPNMYLLEDLHWADESTLALLIHLADRIAQLPVVIVATYRGGYSDDNPALVRTLEELIRMGLRPQKLGGLSEDAIAQMLNGLSQRQAPESLVSLIFEESQGYPFFVEEVYRHLIEEGKIFDSAGQFRTDIKIAQSDVPENVRLIISRRLERLDENEKRVLAAAAVIGRSFSFQLLTEIGQIDVDELFNVIDKALKMGIVVPSSEGPERPFTFSHELVRQTLLGGISAPRQERLHAGVADAIERLNPDAVKERAGEIADHLLKAGSFADGKRLVSYLTMAGKSALEAAAFEEARRHFRSALAHQGAVNTRERADLLTSLAMGERGLDHSDAALTHLREVIEIYINLDDREMIGRSFIELTEALFWFGRFQEAADTAQRGLTYLPTDVSADRVRLLAAFAAACAPAAGYAPADEALREGFNIASQLSDPKLEARLHDVRLSVNFHFLRLQEAAAGASRGEQSGGSSASPWRRGQELVILHLVLLHLGRSEEAMRIVDELEPLAGKIGQSISIEICARARAWREFGKTADLAKLETSLGQAWKSYRKSHPILEVILEVQLSLVDYIRGNWTGALLHAQASCGSEPESHTEGVGTGTLFRQLAYAGDRDGAFAILDQKRTWLPHSGQHNTSGSWFMLALVIEGLAMLGEQAQAAELYPLVSDLLETGAVVLWPIHRFTRTIAGIAAAEARQWEAAEDHFQIALEQAETFPDHLEQTEIRRFHAMMLIARAAPGDREKAQTLLREALESYTQIGMPRHVEMTQTLLDRAADR